MPRFSYMLNSFKSGELGPKTHARTEAEQYKEGLDILENFLVETSGGAFRRGGLVTEVGPTALAADEGEYISVIYKLDRNSVYRVDIKVTTTASATISEVNTAGVSRYSAGTAPLIGRVPAALAQGSSNTHGYSYSQVDGCLIIVHSSGEVEPVIFVPTLNGAGELCLVGFPWLDDIDDTTIAGAVVGTPTKILLKYDSWARYDDVVRTPFDDPNVTDFTMAVGAVSGSTTLVSTADFFVADMASDGSTFNGLRIMIDDGTGKIVVGIITAVTDSKNATVQISVAGAGFSITASNYWYVSGWDKYNGWPKTVELHNGRLVFGGSKNKPATVWASFPFYYGQINRLYAIDIASVYVYGREASLVDGGLEYTIASEGDQEEITWIKSNRTLLLGTATREYAVSLEPTSVSFLPQSNHGGSARAAINAYNSTYFIGEDGQEIYEVKYSEENGAFVSRRITDINDQILHSNALTKRTKYVQMVYVERMKTIFALTDAYQIVAISIDPQAGVLAFSKVKTIQTQHRYIFKAFDPYEEETFLFTRTVNTAARGALDSDEWILRLIPAWDDTIPVGETVDKKTNECFFVDFATYGTNSPASGTLALGADYASLFLTVIARNESGTLRIFEAIQADVSGNITLGENVVYWVAGIPYTSVLKTLTPEVGPNQVMNSQGDVIRIDRITAKLYASWVGEYGADTIYSFEQLNQLTPYTGEERLDIPLGPDNENKVIIQTDQPLPLNILGMVLRGQNNP